MVLCQCGCGEEAKPGNKFIHGHQNRGRKHSSEIIAKTAEAIREAKRNPKTKPEPKLCQCGCGKLAKPGNMFITGHNKGNLGHTGYTYVSSAEREIVICKNCGSEIDALKCNNRVFCNRQCKSEWMSKQKGEGTANWQGGKDKFVCEQCGNEIVDWKSQMMDHNFCCKECDVKWRSINLCGENSPSYGRVNTLGQRISISAALQGVDIDDWSGFKYEEDGNERDTQELRNWRSSVFMRDNFTCQQCGSNNPLQAHHIYMWSKYSDKRFDIDNGITLCKDCHKEVRGYENEYIDMFIMLMN